MRSLLLALFLFSATAHAQGWRWVSPKPQGVAVNAVAFFGTQGWLVGAGGTIAITPDGAQTFAHQNSGTTVALYGVYFQSATTGWAVGDLGTILATTDGGSTWTPQTSGTTRLLRGVWFTDALHGVAVGDYRTLLQTADGGTTWTGRSTTALSLNAVVFTDSLHGFICGDGGAVVLTIDGGNTFTTVQTPSTAHLLALSFADSLHGFAVGEGGAIVATSDGGQSWTAQTVGTDDLVAVVATSATQAYALGEAGAIQATADGATWSQLELLTATSPFTTLALEPTGGAWDATAQSGQWLRAPASSSPPAFADVNDLIPASAAVSSIAFGSADAGVIVAGGLLYATQDQGAHIAQVGPADAGSLPFSWSAVAMASATDAYAVGTRGTAAVSHDQGQTWTLLDAGTFDDLLAVQFLPDSGTGFAVGEAGTMLATQNGGASWTQLEAVTSLSLSSLAFLDPQHGMVGGENGALLFTTDGVTFEVAGDDFFGDITGLAYPFTGVVLACSDEGTLAHSTNQGLSFYDLSAPADLQGFGPLSFVSRQNGWLGGAGPMAGDIWFTSDGAQSFGVQYSGANSFTAFSFVDAAHGYAGGQGGMLLATNTAGGPACQVDADCADAGFAGINCFSGACLPCTTDDRCGPTCTACPMGMPYCYGGYCGLCESDSQCPPGGYCVLGECQMTASTIGGATGGATTTTTTGTSGGGSIGGTGGGSSGGSIGSTSGAASTGSCPPNQSYCQTSSCGCGAAKGGGVWSGLLLAVLALWRRARRGQGQEVLPK